MKENNYYEKYPKSLKEAIARTYLSGKGSYQEVAESYGLSNRRVVIDIVKRYKKKGSFVEKADNMLSHLVSNLEAASAEIPVPIADISLAPSALLAEIASLQKQLIEAELRRSSAEILLTISIEATGYDPRKKPGTKR